MSRSKLYFFLVILMLITVGTFMAGLEAQNTEEKRVMVQEFVKKAEEFVKQNQIEKAIEIYERIVKALPEDFEYRVQLATLYSRINQHEKAAQIWNQLLEADPENTAYQDELVESLQDAGKADEAFELAQTYIQTHPEVGVHYARLAKLYADEDNVDAAIVNYEKAIELAYGDKQTYLKLAELYFVNDNIDAAEKALKNAILHTTSERDQQSIGQQLVNLYRYQGNLEEKLQKAENDGTITFEMQKERARHFRNLEEKLQKAEDDGTITFEMQKERARHFLNTSELEKSADAFKKALEMAPNPYERNFVAEELIAVHIKQGRRDLVLESYVAEASKQSRSEHVSTSFGSSGITFDFGSDDTRKTLINAYKSQGELEVLRTLFEGKLEKDADNPAIIEILAEIYWEASDYQKSAEAYHMLSKVEPGNVRSFYYAAAAFHKSNQSDMVKAVLNQADSALTSSKFKRDTGFQGAIATICLESEMYDTAIKLADDAITKEESKDNSWGLEYFYAILAKSYHGAKRYEEAFTAYQQMANVADDNYERGRAKTEMKKIAKVGKLYEKWIPEQLKKVEENPNDPKPILKLAESYEATDKIKEAIAQYERLAELEPEDLQWYKKLGDLYQNIPPERRETGEVVEGTALSLSGNRSYVEINHSETLNNITDQVTVSAWIKPTDYPNRYAPIIYRGDERVPDIKNRSYILHLKAGGFIQLAASPNGAGEASIYSPPNVIQLNRWHHIAAVIDATNDSMQLFIDGVEVRNRNFRGKKLLYKSRLPLRIGWTHEEERPTISSFIGQIDEVRIWNIARTEAEISTDMNKQLNGDEPGLVGYWKFDEETEGKIADTSPNKNDGKRIGNAKLEPYTRQIFVSLRPEQLAKSIAAYKIAVGFEPTSYQLYDLLAKTYIKAAQPSQAEAAYRQALDAPLKQSEHDSAMRAIFALYADEGQENKRIAFLEEIKPTMDESAVLHKLLGDLYKKVGDTDKAEIAYAKWLQIRQKALNRQQSTYQYLNFVNELLDKELFPETALKLAKRAYIKNSYSNPDFPEMLGRACIANGLYDEALKLYKHTFSVISSEYSFDNFWGKITDAGNRVNDKGRYYKMLDTLANSIPPTYSGFRINVNRIIVKLGLAEYYSKNNMYDKAMEQMQQTGMIAENAWLTLGPFDNTGGVGFNTEYILEDTTQIDLTGQYEGVNEQISWKKLSDDTFNGFIDFGSDTNWRVSYAWATVASPDERKVHFRFDSDDQGKIWLNGVEIFANSQDKSISLDRDIIPVTLKAGKNTILVKVCNEEKTHGFYLRVTDTDGKPYEDLQINDVPDTD